MSVSTVIAAALVLMAITSGVTAALYAWDKRAAVRGIGRIREQTLLIWSALGGWPGGILAGRRLRHKTFKRSYRVKFCAAALINLSLQIGIVWVVVATL